MTVEERLDRLGHYTVGEIEERRKDREENRQLWRDTQRQINELTLKIADTNDLISRFADEFRVGIAELRGETRVGLAAFRDESRAADARLGERIDALVSAIGQMLSKPQ